jgi:hypothetical protein
MSTQWRWLKNIENDPAACAELARGIRPITTGTRLSKDGTRSLWYQGAERYFDIFFEIKEQRLTWAQLSLRGLVLSYDSASRYLRVDSTDELEPAERAISTSRTLTPLPPDVASSFTAVVKHILAARQEDPFFSAFSRLLKPQA